MPAYPPVFGVDGDAAEAALDVEGEIPPWLAGALFAVGPAQFEVGGAPLAHWLDGHARAVRVAFEGGAATVAARFLDTTTRREAVARGEVAFAGFATRARRAWWRRWFAPLRSPPDNANAGLTMLGEHLVAFGEASAPLYVDPATLTAQGVLPTLRGEMESPHPVGRLNVATRFEKPSGHILFERGADGSRNVLARLPSPAPSYVHSFAATERHVALVHCPLLVDPARKRGTPLAERMTWRPERGTRFTLLDRASGALVAEATSPTFFALHTVGAWERGNDVLVDLVAHQDAGVVSQLTHANLASGRVGRLTGRLWRCRVPLTGGFVETQRLAEEPIEFPATNPARRPGPARHVWGIGTDRTRSDGLLDQLVRVDTQDPESAPARWREPGAWPSPPVFVPRPGARTEEDGVLLSLVFHDGPEASSLLVLDGSSLKELARGWLPAPVPFTGHGVWLA